MKELSSEKCRIWFRGDHWVVSVPLCFDKDFETGQDAIDFVRDLLERVAS